MKRTEWLLVPVVTGELAEPMLKENVGLREGDGDLPCGFDIKLATEELPLIFLAALGHLP